jgi:uncharacterized RDD family membrane protein YckC
MNAEPISDSFPEACPACGHPAQGGEHRCEKCGRWLVGPNRIATRPRSDNPESKLRVVIPAAESFGAAKGSVQGPGVRPSAARKRAPAFPEPLRRQLSEQVQDFRTRRRRPGLPFPSSEESREAGKVVPIAEPHAAPERGQTDRMEERKARYPRSPSQLQSPLAFPDAEPERRHVEFSTPPVASFRVRVLGNCLDCAWILAAVGVFLVPLPLLAGEVAVDRYIIAASLAAACAVALLYGVVFLYLAGATPAMRRMGLRLVNFDGQPASRAERLWRLLGSIASAGSFLLGFFWAAMDDEKFSWHDRISRTFLTVLAPDER